MENIMTMPANFAVLNANEMEYTDGGISLTWTWYGAAISLTHRETELLQLGYDIASCYPNEIVKAACKFASQFIGYQDKGNGVTLHCTIVPVTAIAWVSSN